MEKWKCLMDQRRLVGGTFFGADLERGVFHGADLEKGVFHGADLERGVFHSGAMPQCAVRREENPSARPVAAPAPGQVAVTVRPPAGQLRQQQEFPRYGEDNRLPYAA